MPTVLVADDDPEELHILETILRGLGVRALKARNGEEALRSLLAEDVDMVILDYMMPGLSGLETAAVIRRLERCRDLPILMLTDFDQRIVRAPWRAGELEYMRKPADAEALGALVLRACGASKPRAPDTTGRPGSTA